MASSSNAPSTTAASPSSRRRAGAYRPAVTVTGASSNAEEEKAVEIEWKRNACIIRVKLPGGKAEGVADVRYEFVEGGRKLRIRGVVVGGEAIRGCAHSGTSVVSKRVRRITPPAAFTVTFELPKRVDKALASHSVSSDGMLEMVFLRRIALPPHLNA